jgi:site-specific DNA recombinase
VRQGLARLIDSYAEGLLEKHEFEPRITRLRQRLTQLEEQRQQLIDVTALQTEIRLIVGRLEDFAAKIDAGLEDSDWLSKREMIRALVKRVEVTPDRVNVVFRVDSYPEESNLEKKSLQLCRGSDTPVTVYHFSAPVRCVQAIVGSKPRANLQGERPEEKPCIRRIER